MSRRKKDRRSSEVPHKSKPISDQSKQKEVTTAQSTSGQTVAVASSELSIWKRTKTLLASPIWQGTMALLAILVAAGIYEISHIHDGLREKETAEQTTSQIEYAWFIRPDTQRRIR
jgi:hypothetical protein